MKKEIKARIDSHNKIVYASHADQVRDLFLDVSGKSGNFSSYV
jgi:hypothetical protein